MSDEVTELREQLEGAESEVRFWRGISIALCVVLGVVVVGGGVAAVGLTQRARADAELAAARLAHAEASAARAQMIVAEVEARTAKAFGRLDAEARRLEAEAAGRAAPE